MTTRNITKIDTQNAEASYLEFVNDFLTIPAMADFYGVDETYLRGVIELGKIQHRYTQFCKVAKNWKR
jgi:hypothetical protein